MLSSRLDTAPATLVLHNARVLTMDPARPAAEAVAIAGPRIARVGSNIEVKATTAATANCIDCHGLTLLPGFIDAHVHLLAQASALRSADCAVCSIDELVARLRSAASALAPGAWLRGHGYHQSALVEGRHPTRHDLDRAAPDRPVRIIHASGHASVLNSAGLTAAGITGTTPEPPGGTIDRELDTGEPSGLLLEMEDRLDRAMPPPDRGEMKGLLRHLSDRFLAAGVTSVQDLGHRNDRRRAAFFADVIAAGAFRPRLNMATGYDAFAESEEAGAEGIGSGPVKIMLNETGEDLLPDLGQIQQRVLSAHRAGRRVAIHATQQRSIEAALDAIAAAAAATGVRLRDRIEHASVTPPEIATRMAELGVTAVSNPSFLWQHGDRYLEDVCPGDLPWLYDVAGLLNAGVHVAAGSDCPIAPPEPVTGIVAARNRRTRSGASVPGTGANLHQALALFTRGAAFAAGEEAKKGRIAPGLLADLVLIDLRAEAPRPVLTVLGGAVAWRSDTPALNLPEAVRR